MDCPSCSSWAHYRKNDYPGCQRCDDMEQKLNSLLGDNFADWLNDRINKAVDEKMEQHEKYYTHQQAGCPCCGM